MPECSPFYTYGDKGNCASIPSLLYPRLENLGYRGVILWKLTFDSRDFPVADLYKSGNLSRMEWRSYNIIRHNIPVGAASSRDRSHQACPEYIERMVLLQYYFMLLEACKNLIIDI